MSKRRLPWLKLYSEVYRDPDLNGMPLEQQALYFRLLAYANEQEPRGSFDVSDIRKLARHVAPGHEAVLEETLDYLEHDWQTIEVRDGRAYFRSWERYQRPASSEPEAVNERQRSYKERAEPNNEPVTGRSRASDAPQEIEIEREEEIEKEPGTVAREKNGVGSISIVAALGVEGDREAEEAVAATVASRPDLNHIAQAQACRLEYPDWPRWTRRERAKRFAKWVGRAYPQQQAGGARASPESESESGLEGVYQMTAEDYADMDRKYAAEQRAKEKREREAAALRNPPTG